MIGCAYSPEQEHHYNARGTCVWCGEYQTRRITVPQAYLPEGMTIDRHQGQCKGRISVTSEGARCMGCGKRFVVGVIVKYTEARDGDQTDG